MHINFTDTAVFELSQAMKETSSRIKLVFDSEGCGCSANGVATLWLVSSPKQNDLTATGDPFEVLFEPKDEIYFEDKMLIDYLPGSHRYVLKSNNQIYNAHMSLIKKQ